MDEGAGGAPCLRNDSRRQATLGTEVVSRRCGDELLADVEASHVELYGHIFAGRVRRPTCGRQRAWVFKLRSNLTTCGT